MLLTCIALEPHYLPLKRPFFKVLTPEAKTMSATSLLHRQPNAHSSRPETNSFYFSITCDRTIHDQIFIQHARLQRFDVLLDPGLVSTISSLPSFPTASHGEPKPHKCMPEPLLPDPPLSPLLDRQTAPSRLTPRSGDVLGLHGSVICITRCSGTLSQIPCGFLSRTVRCNTHTLRPQRVFETRVSEEEKRTQI